MAYAEVRVLGAEPLIVTFEETARRAMDVSPLGAEIFARFEEITREQFASVGGRAGNVWEPLSYDWLRRKWQAGQRLEILHATDEMFDSLTKTTDESVRVATNDSFEFGSTSEQFNYQQDPDEASVNHPIRRPIDLTARDGEMFAELISAYVVGEVNRAGMRTTPSGRFAKGGKL